MSILLAVFLVTSAPAGEPESCEFRIVNWNAAGTDPTHGNNNQPIKVGDAVLKYVKQIDANVITLQEVMVETVTYLRTELPGWTCLSFPFGQDHIAICVDGAATNLTIGTLTPDPNKPDTGPPPEFPWWGYLQVEYRGVRIASVHTRSFWRNHHRAELHRDVTSGIVAGDFNHIDPTNPGWFQTDLDLEWTWEGDYLGDDGQWKIDHILSVDAPQAVSGDAADKEGSNHRVVLATIVYSANTDRDDDGVPDCQDNCPDDANSNQADGNNNGIGDACEPECGADACGAGIATGMLLSLWTLCATKLGRRRASARRKFR